jgi:transcriptional regulator with XRE-family HTH domain
MAKQEVSKLTTAEELTIDYRIEIAKRLFCRMESLGINQSEVARRIGSHRVVVNRILKGEKNLTLTSIAKLSIGVAWDLLKNEPIDKIYHNAK